MQRKGRVKRLAQTTHTNKTVNYYSETLITLIFILSVIILKQVWKRKTKLEEFPNWNVLEAVLEQLNGKWVDILFIDLETQKATVLLKVYEKIPSKDAVPTSKYYCTHLEASRLRIFEGRFTVRITDQGAIMLTAC